MRQLGLLLLLFLLPAYVIADAPAYIGGMMIQPAKTHTLFTFLLTKKTSGHVKSFTQPDRVVVDFANTRKNFDMNNAKLGGTVVQSISSEATPDGGVRFTFMTNGKVHWTTTFLPASENNVVRFQLDIIADTVETPSVKTDAKQAQNEIDSLLADLVQAAKAAKQARLTTMTVKKQHIFTVVVDAGHGGKDTGAIGPSGIAEKNIVLAIAKKLAQKINQQPNMRAVLTRDGDYFVTLRNRLMLARKHEADLFVAVHADAYMNALAQGASVYALSSRGATSEAARWLAQRDNYSELGGVELDGLQDDSTMLRSVLIDLAQTATIRDSLRLGKTVLSALSDVSTLHYRRVEQAPFVVLKSPDIPSILVETGFVSNPVEAKRLTDSRYQDQLAQAIMGGISKYAK